MCFVLFYLWKIVEVSQIYRCFLLNVDGKIRRVYNSLYSCNKIVKYYVNQKTGNRVKGDGEHEKSIEKIESLELDSYAGSSNCRNYSSGKSHTGRGSDKEGLSENQWKAVLYFTERFESKGLAYPDAERKTEKILF